MRVWHYNLLLRLMMRKDLPAARRYGEQGWALARRIKYPVGETRLLNNLAAACYAGGDLMAAQRYFEELVVGAKRTNQCELLGNAYLGLGNVMGALDEVDRALVYYEQARGIYASCDPPVVVGQALVLNNTGTNYLNTHQTAKAARPVRQAAALVGKFKHPWLEATLLINLGTLQKEEGHTDSAVATWQRALTLGKKLDDQTSQSAALGHLSEEKAITDPNAALPIIQEALKLARETEDPELEATNMQVQALIYHRLGQSRKAYETLAQYVILHDTVSGQALHAVIAKQQVRFDVAQQRDRIRDLEQQRRISRLRAERQEARTRTYGLAAGSLLLLLLLGGGLVGLLIRSRRRLQTSETALRVANQTKDQLMHIIGHDLRGPIASFQQLTPLLHEVVRQPDLTDAHELIRNLDAGAQQLGGLVDNLFQWTRTRSGQLVNQPVRLSAELIVESIGSLYAPAAQLKNIHLTYEAPPDLMVWADVDLLATVLRNLVGNALKFTPSGGTVRLTAESVEEDAQTVVEFTVTDTGVGVALERLAQFFQADRAASTVGTAGEPGTGLGLPLSARFVQLLGGELRAESTPGQGSRFWFRVTSVG